MADGELWWHNQSECLEFLLQLQVEMLRMLVWVKGSEVFDGGWLLPNARTVEQLAKSIVRTRVFGDSPVLADALEEAGCNNMDLLTRCRAVPPEAAANWVANLLVLGAEGTFDRQIEPTSN